jgi:hypothetical protein
MRPIEDVGVKMTGVGGVASEDRGVYERKRRGVFGAVCVAAGTMEGSLSLCVSQVGKGMGMVAVKEVYESLEVCLSKWEATMEKCQREQM